MKQKDNDNLLEKSKCLKQSKLVLEAHIVKDILGNYVENLREFKNATGAEENKKIKSEEFNKLMAYLLITNSDQSKSPILSNVLASHYSTKNNQHPKDSISTADIMKNHWLDNYGTRKNRAQNIEKRKFQETKKLE